MRIGKNARVLWLIPALAMAIAILCVRSAQAQLIESFENSADGWTISPFGSAGNQANFQIAGFSTTSGVTDGTSSMAVGPTAANTGSGPDYSQLLASPAAATTYGTNLTNTLANASALSFDVFAPSGSFNGFLQFDFDINNTATGFKSLDSFSYPATSLGSEKTFSFPIDATNALNWPVPGRARKSSSRLAAGIAPATRRSISTTFGPRSRRARAGVDRRTGAEWPAGDFVGVADRIGVLRTAGVLSPTPAVLIFGVITGAALDDVDAGKRCCHEVP